MVTKGANLMMYGKDTDLKKTKVFKYNGVAFDSVGADFSLKKWYDFPFKATFATGKADGASNEAVYLLTTNLTKVVPDFTAENIVRLNDRFYGIVGKFNGKTVEPEFKGKKPMLILDATTWKYSIVKSSADFAMTAYEY